MKRSTVLRLCAAFILLSFVNNTPAQPYFAGDTHRHQQAPGTVGRTIGHDDLGFAHPVWTNQFNQNAYHAYYNVWDPAFGDFLIQTGIQIDIEIRATASGQTTLPSGFCFPVYHAQAVGPTVLRPVAAIDFLPQTGAFTGFAPTGMTNTSKVYPQIAHTANGDLHMVSRVQQMETADPQPLLYSRGTPEFESGFGFEINWQNVAGTQQYLILDSTNTFGYTIAATPNGDQIAVVYTRHPDLSLAAEEPNNNDVFVVRSEDNGLNWSAPQNITNFLQPDRAAYCAGADFMCCNRDTLRAFDQVTALFDNSGYLNVAYTTIGYYHWLEDGHTHVRRDRAMIWYWNEISPDHQLVAESWDTSPEESGALRGLGTEQAMVEHPNISIDGSTGWYYCTYLKYDTAQHLPDETLINADIFIARPIDNSWTESTQLTFTAPQFSINRNEQELSVAERAVDGKLYCQYLLHTADSYETGDELSEIYFHLFDLDSIEFDGILPERNLHAIMFECDTVASSTVTLHSVTDMLCDSVLLVYSTSSLRGVDEMHIFRNGEYYTMAPVLNTDPITWADYAPSNNYDSYFVRGWSRSCGYTVSSDTLIGYAGYHPAQVQDFAATLNNYRAVHLTWSPNAEADSLDQYTVYRDQLSIGFTEPGVTQYWDTVDTPGLHFEYGVVGHNRCGDGPIVTDSGGTIPVNEGHANLVLVSAGPPNWDYRLDWIDGCVNQLIIRSLCPGTTASFVEDPDFWQVESVSDSVVFTGGPLCGTPQSVTGFRLTNDDPNCIGSGVWSAGNGGGTIGGPLPVSIHTPLPTEFSVNVYPNPFNPNTNFEIAIPQTADTRLLVYNLNGQLVREISLGQLSAGFHTVQFGGNDLPTGMYFAKVLSGSFQSTHKLMLVK